ncbi:D-3-phosphoglycerate dehydrogenase-like [Daphnia pulicaria]|uniref:D-3-phosphoglycerate dehydrogenase-like n=1 Tax=Daphnia pulicaria TaxID=35523 RepID=UPI001EEA8A88|nr:D-3-phosphoglycerate dehydrogenase-like [Daphnia pulicaria]XP_046649853.1 D-3-phosphoglycerate dehydrogenase-like [Daphnia pulicaria]
MTLDIQQVLISDPVDPICSQILQNHGISVTYARQWTKERLLQEIQNYEVLIVRSETKVTDEVLAAATKLRLVGRAGTGLDNVDISAATRRGVLVMNTPGGNTMSAAEHTCAMIAALSRHIPQACAALKNGVWDRKTYMGNELHGSTLAILGLGRIGREVAIRMQAFGMKTIGYDPVISKESAAEFKVDKMELEEIWPLADYISVHTPYMPQTHHLINAEALKRCKSTVRIINIARGGIVDEAALLDALISDRCKGAALDVFVQEPPKEGTTTWQLIQHPRVVCTPHLGASTVEAQERVAREIAEQLIDLAEGRQAVGIANAPNLARSMVERNKPWMQLAQALGYLANSLAEGSLHRRPAEAETNVELICCGEGTEDVNLLASSALVGHLNGMKANGINIINAAILARDAGLVTSARHINSPKDLSLREDLDKLLQLTVTRDSYSIHLIGSVQGGNPVLYAINDCWFPFGATLSGNVLLFNGKQPDTTLTALVGALATSSVGVSALMCTRPGTSCWLALRTGETFQNPQQFNGPDATFIAQLVF